MSLTKFHLVFILFAIVTADMFGAWAVWEHSRSGDNMALLVGVLSFVVGFALIVYVVYLVRKLDKAKIK